MNPCKRITAEQIATSILRQKERYFEDMPPRNEMASLAARGIVAELKSRGEKPGLFIGLVADRTSIIPTAHLLSAEKAHREAHSSVEALVLRGIEEELLARRCPVRREPMPSLFAPSPSCPVERVSLVARIAAFFRRIFA